MYNPVDQKVSFPEMEEGLLRFWKDNAVFQKSIDQRKNAPEYVFYDGPPFATGLPHFGHFIPSTIKDIVPRYQTMRGKRVERRFGWDCHGLPVENLIEKKLGLNSKTDIEKFGVANFNEECRKSVLQYVDEWEKTITRLGRWVDFKNDYKTMNTDYMESIWWVVKQLWEKQLLYQGSYILPYCPRCSTVLSNHELSLGGYQDVHDPAITVRFLVTCNTDGVMGEPIGENHDGPPAYFLAWTTTPWTLPSNLGLTVGPDIDYVKVRDNADGDCYILGEARLRSYYKSDADYTVVWKKKGRELAGLTYEPLFPYFAPLAALGAFQVKLGDFVSTEDGTGIVHTAPGFGEDDNRVFKGSGVPSVCPIDSECKFTSEVPDYEGRFVKDCDRDIMDRLKAEGKLIKKEQILHAYPHCWRCGSPLIYRGIGSWFVAVEKIKPQLLAANEGIYWQPEHIKAGRFGKWLEGARDWAVSRNRYWGNPIPIWECGACHHQLCVGSRAELKTLSGTDCPDLHKHFVDEITIPCPKCGEPMKRVPEVLDCWFESGAMPYAQNHYPFENKEFFEAHYPADFISEGLDQTRGWFYTLTVLAAALFDRPAFKNCVVSGIVLAGDGKKMSKSLNNYTDPAEALNKFGADAMRLFLIHSPAVRADEIKYSDEGVRDVIKDILLPLWNSYSFFVTYANIDRVTAGLKGNSADAASFAAAVNPLDTWILSVTQKLVKEFTEAMDAYDFAGAVDPLVRYIESLNNWYIRRSRRRFWKNESDSDKAEAYETLYRALKTFALVASPVVPFITEAMWQNLRLEKDPISVHLADFPSYNDALRDKALEFKMDSVQKAVSLGRALRYQFNLKIRQPLKSVEFVTKDAAERNALLEMEESIREELNVKKVVFHEREDELVEYRAKANFRTLGKEMGSLMQAAAAEIAKLDQDSIQSILEGSVLTLEAEGTSFEIDGEKIIVERIEKAKLRVINEGTLTVALDTEITDDLQKEGNIRDLVRGVQNLRKDRGLAVTDRIKLTLGGSPGLKAAWENFADFVSTELLAVEVKWDADLKGGVEIAGDTEKWQVLMERA